jgi:xylose isomerase
VDELTLAMYEILKGGGFTNGGFNFDSKLRRQSIDRLDLFHGHIGGMDTLARALLAAATLIERGDLADKVTQRYSGWSKELGQGILTGTESLDTLEAKVLSQGIDPQPISGGQEHLENIVNRTIWFAEP